MKRIANEVELISEIQDSVQGLIELVKTQVKFAQEGNRAGDANTTERGIFKGLLQLGMQLMCLYFAGLGDGDVGQFVEVDGVKYKRGGKPSPSSLLTVFGVIRFKRFLYYRIDNVKERSLKFVDCWANLPDCQASYFVTDWLSRLGVKYTAYEEAVRFVKDLFGLSLSKHTAEDAVADLEVSYDAYEESREFLEVEEEGELCVVQSDGKGVPMHVSERTGEGTKKEALTGCVYTVNRHQRTAEAVAKSLTSKDLLSSEEKQELMDRDRARNIHYRSSLKNSKEEEFEKLAKEVNQRRGSRELVCVLDGAAVLLRLAGKHFPDAKIILDIIHVLDYLWPAVHAFEKEGTAKADATACFWLTLILSGKVGSVIGALRQRITKSGHKLASKQKEDVKAAIRYYENHRQYMRYDEYLEAGYPIGTGVIESACGHIVKDRMEISGARWKRNGAEPVLHLRCVYNSNEWVPYQEFHQNQQLNHLYYRELAA